MNSEGFEIRLQPWPQRSHVTNLAIMLTVVLGLMSETTFGTHLALGFAWAAVLLSAFLAPTIFADKPAIRVMRLRFALRPHSWRLTSVALDLLACLLLAEYAHWETLAFFGIATVLSIAFECYCIREVGRTPFSIRKEDL